MFPKADNHGLSNALRPFRTGQAPAGRSPAFRFRALPLQLFMDFAENRGSLFEHVQHHRVEMPGQGPSVAFSDDPARLVVIEGGLASRPA